jgi:hypothetical protein
MKIAILDDYLDAVLKIADWSALPAETSIERFTDHLTDEDALAERLAPFDIIVAKRERTPFPRSLLTQHQDRYCHRNPTWHSGNRDGTFWHCSSWINLGLILALMRNIPGEDRAIREGRWRDGLGMTLEGRTLGIVGLGRIGTKIAALGQTFGMTVIAWL